MESTTSQIAFFGTLKNSFLGKNLLSLNQNKETKKPEHFLIKGIAGSYLSMLVNAVFSDIKKTIIFICNDKEEALYFLNECEEYLGKDKVLFFPSSYLNPYQIEEVQNANVVLRTEVLNKLSQESSETSSEQNNHIIVTYSKALTEKVISKTILQDQTFTLTKNEQVDIPFITELLFSYHFKHTDFVTEPGEFSIRGGIVDIFSFSDEYPVRISFFGNEIESIRKFNIENQLSIENIAQFSLVPNIDAFQQESEKISFFEYVPKNSLFLLKDFDLILKNLKSHFQKAEEIFLTKQQTLHFKKPEELYVSENEAMKHLLDFQTYEIGNTTEFKNTETIQLQQTETPFFHKNFELLLDDLLQKQKENYTIHINFSSEKQANRLEQIFKDLIPKSLNIPRGLNPLEHQIDFKTIFLNLNKGFIDSKEKILVYADHQIFERYHAYKTRTAFAKSEALTLKELTDYSIGDFITHIDHGIGKFMGLQRISNNGKIQEAIKIVYQNNDILYVNIHSLHKISRYTGKDGKEIVLNKLGSPAWKNLKNKTKKNVKQVAFDLIKLYAQRKAQAGFAFAPDGYLQHELEASFMYEDTPDQEKATLEVKADMEKPTAMDRLICGDVGFGKTEVAIRAAFKAAVDGKQVAILVPTTILAFQHYNTFNKRLADFPITVDYINRFRSTKTVTEIKKKLAEGKIEILIGTQSIVGKDIKFKDLGLLIVDEEHKFGVGVKDKLKTLKTTVDTLTLTATPIPRTLQFSLMSARDMSVIKTPPANRQPVSTELIGFSEEQIRDAIVYEMNRDGQVYFLNNRIENLPEIAGMIQRLVPEAKISIGHGQMEGKKMEDVLIGFMKGNCDVLLSTTIIESGLDVPNANTIFINNAHQFGLADLHQMRGRVGRSDRKAFCYLISPPMSVLTNEARKRLEAITQFSDLGSGFYIAMKDLEIRGAGDLLGGEQSGFMNNIGFETYQKILQEAIEELKTDEFADLFEEENQKKDYVTEVTIDTDLEILFPDFYINNVEERFALYQKLSDINNETELQNFENELVDRFGKIPKETKNLLESIELKWIAKELGIEKITLKNEIMLCYFIQNEESKFYQTATFQKIIQYLHQNPSEASMKQKIVKDEKSLYLRKDKMKNINNVKQFLEKMKQNLG